MTVCPTFPLHFFQQRHIVRDGNKHVALLGLLLDKAPLDAEVLVCQQAVLAETRFSQFERSRRVFFVRPGPIHQDFRRLFWIRLQKLQAA
jgi:hypothetical protein